jgi:hypothetical protein
MAIRLAAAGGQLGNLSGLKNMGICEVHYVVRYNSGTYDGMAAAIKNAGMSPVLNEFNDGACFPSCGDQTAHFQALKNAGWEGVGGEGVAGDTVASAQNVFPYCNYGGIVSEQQANMYAPPYSHPAGGKHADYIETYNNNGGLIIDSFKASYNAAKAAGSCNLGILIGLWGGVMNYDWPGLINSIGGCKTALFWCGYDYDPTGMCGSLASQIGGALGAANTSYTAACGGATSSAGGGSGSTGSSGSTGGTATTTTTTTATKIKVNVQGLDNSLWKSYKPDALGVYFSGIYYTQVLPPRLRYRINIVNPTDGMQITFDSDTTKSHLLELSGSVDNAFTTDTFQLKFDNSDFHTQKYLQLNSRVKIWLGWENSVFTDDNYIFGGYISHVDAINVYDKKSTCTVSGWERLLSFPKYKISTLYEWIELGYLMAQLYEKEAEVGIFNFANTGVVVDRFVAKDQRMSDAFDSILSSFENYEDNPDPIPTEYEPQENPSEGCGTLYGEKKGNWWTFNMYGDEEQHAWFKPIQIQGTKFYAFEKGKNLYSLEREYPSGWTENGKYSPKDFVATWTAEVPLIPEVNTTNNNVVTLITETEDGMQTYHMVVTGIEYSLDPVMKVHMFSYEQDDAEEVLGGMSQPYWPGNRETIKPRNHETT